MKPDPALVTMWRVIYWTLQVLSWILLPIFQSYLYTGEFLAIFRWLRAILDNLITYSIMLLVGGLGLGGFCIYIAISNANDPANAQIISLDLIAGLGLSLSNIYGLVLLVGFIGYGIIAVPRYLWETSNDERQLQLYEFTTPTIVEELEELENELLDYLGVCKILERKVDSTHKQFKNVERIMMTVEEVIRDHPQLNKAIRRSTSRDVDDGLLPKNIEDLSRSDCVKIHRLLQKAIREFSSKQYQWKHLQKKAFILQDVIHSKENSSDMKVASPFRSPRPKVVQTIIEKPEWIYVKYLRSLLLKLLALAFVPFGLIIMWCEFTPLFKNIYATKRLSLSILELIIMSMRDRFAIQIVALLILGLILVTLLFAMYRVRILYLFQMVPHHTDSYTLFYTALLLCRAIPTMCFNFLQMVGVDPDDGVAYFAIYGALRVDGLRIFGLLGGFIVDYFPLLIIVVAFITMFKLIERCGTLCNIQRFSYTGSNMSDETILEGREILHRARAKKLRQLQNVSAEKISSSFDKLEENDLRSAVNISLDENEDFETRIEIDDNIKLVEVNEDNYDYDDFSEPQETKSSHKSRLDRVYEKHGRERPNPNDYSKNTSFTDTIKNKLKSAKKNFDSVL
ncbi:predicted protein [Naegleria gruberi]|uniref:Predicted protein n=1 Tax=Naegleria gruberi TaxID=5762 RepID=D2VMX3_NAEGR|nr:uncharacterized protein NAEGRDRAFT_50875 [Naegleria gruberi]EFC41898.1 predicted protein [Naegleria gruberi]|eukprot:XP_002674642.1 predicted protein [Naegleria gruberi strain NEG-M]